MPAEKIATTFVNNGPGDTYTNILRVQWGAKGAVPEAPDGWVNAGYALIEIRRDDDPPERDTHYVAIDPEEIDHLIHTLKRVRRQAFREGKPALSSDEERFVDQDGRLLRAWAPSELTLGLSGEAMTHEQFEASQVTRD